MKYGFFYLTQVGSELFFRHLPQQNNSYNQFLDQDDGSDFRRKNVKFMSSYAT